MSANSIQPIFPTAATADRATVTIVIEDDRQCFQGLREVQACANTLTVWEKEPGSPACAWQQLDSAQWSHQPAVHRDRKYYSHQTEHPLLAGLRDPIDALKIGLSTLWEKIKRFLAGKDLFFLSRQIKQDAQAHIRNGIRHCQENKQTDRGGFIKRGHAHLGIALPTHDNERLYIAVDPAVNRLGPGYSPQLPPVIPEGLENTDLVLISHAHLDHFKDTPLYRLYPHRPSLLERIIEPFQQCIRRLSGQPEINPVPTAPIRTRLCFPAGSEQIDTLFRETLENNCNDGTSVGLPADAFVPYTIKRPGSDDTIATLVAIPTKHWAGTNPLTNFHKAPGFGYLLMTEKECIFDAGDTGYSQALYDAVAAMAAKNPHPGGPKHVTALFSPAGPDFERKHMEKTHQATIDTARCITKLQLLPFIEAKPTPTNTKAKQDLLREFMTETECHFVHWGHYKLGPIHYEDPWICWLQLIHEVMDFDLNLSLAGEGAVDLQDSLNDPTYKATLTKVKTQLFADMLALNGSPITPNDDVTPELAMSSRTNVFTSETEEQQESEKKPSWNDFDIAKILLKTLLTQVATHHETSFGHPQHGIVTEWILANFEDIDLEHLTIDKLSTWFFTHPDDRTESLLNTLFCPVDQATADIEDRSFISIRSFTDDTPDLSLRV